MDPMTWKKEVLIYKYKSSTTQSLKMKFPFFSQGISSHWSGMRGFRRKCCKVCCDDTTCTGCTTCRGCTNGPIRGNYDGLVVLTAITKETLPNYHTVMTGTSDKARRLQEKFLGAVSPN